jgi:hypothetical protein
MSNNILSLSQGPLKETKNGTDEFLITGAAGATGIWRSKCEVKQGSRQRTGDDRDDLKKGKIVRQN